MTRPSLRQFEASPMIGTVDPIVQELRVGLCGGACRTGHQHDEDANFHEIKLPLWWGESPREPCPPAQLGPASRWVRGDDGNDLLFITRDFNRG